MEDKTSPGRPSGGSLNVGTAVLGILLFQEPTSVIRLVCITLIVAEIIGLKLT